jgi:hypothetical protein
MVSESTQTFVLEVLDYQIDFNIKLIIFATVIFYVFLLHYIRKKSPVDNFSSAVFHFFSGIYIYTTAFFLPLFTIMLFRDYDAISLWTLLWQGYGVVFVIAALALVVLGGQKVLDMFGIDFDLGMSKREKKRKGEE